MTRAIAGREAGPGNIANIAVSLNYASSTNVISVYASGNGGVSISLIYRKRIPCARKIFAHGHIIAEDRPECAWEIHERLDSGATEEGGIIGAL